MKKIVLIRHAESQPSKDVPDPQWPLSEKGKVQAQELISKLEELEIEYLVSSPYPRAIDTVKPFADKNQIICDLHQDIRERRLTDGMIENWMEELEKTWLHFNYKLPGGESSAECQERVFQF
jgi:2,3-bisphosphoglycerate-dependent phosphoglycerate mutase